MRECNNCDYFEGYNDIGEPYCEYEGGYEGCPYNDEAEIDEKATTEGLKIEIDAALLSEYVRETLKNTIQKLTQEMVKTEIKSIVTDTYKAEVQELTRKAISEVVDQQVAQFMAGDISIGGGWSGPTRTLSRTDYMTELVQQELGERFQNDTMKKQAQSVAHDAIAKFSENLKRDINEGVKQYFDEATRQTLTENVVSMLMSTDTYQRLSQSMNHFLPDGK